MCVCVCVYRYLESDYRAESSANRAFGASRTSQLSAAGMGAFGLEQVCLPLKPIGSPG